jgi:transposase
MQAALRQQGLVVNHKKVKRLVREHGLQPRMRRLHTTTTDSDHDHPIFRNLAKDEYALIDGVTTTVKVAHVRLCHSRMVFVRAYPRETQEMVFDAHERAFALFKGARPRPLSLRRWARLVTRHSMCPISRRARLSASCWRMISRR